MTPAQYLDRTGFPPAGLRGIARPQRYWNPDLTAHSAVAPSVSGTAVFDPHLSVVDRNAAGASAATAGCIGSDRETQALVATDKHSSNHVRVSDWVGHLFGVAGVIRGRRQAHPAAAMPTQQLRARVGQAVGVGRKRIPTSVECRSDRPEGRR